MNCRISIFFSKKMPELDFFSKRLGLNPFSLPLDLRLQKLLPFSISNGREPLSFSFTHKNLFLADATPEAERWPVTGKK